MKKILTLFTITILAFVFSFMPVLAEDDQQTPDQTPCEGDCGDYIYNRNCAMVTNTVYTRANTGLNTADGSYAGAGGAGGAIANSGEGDVQESATGAGGAGGNAGVGGTIVTGNATATTDVKNLVNSNLTDINRCACTASSTDCACSTEKVRNINRVYLGNEATTEANTGLNEARGSYAGAGGTGGVIVNSNGGDIEKSTTGGGANGGSSAAGGLVQSGESISLTSIINVVNRNLTRILR